MLFSILISAITLFLTVKVDGACFVGNGTDRNPFDGDPVRYQPCDAKAGTSMCCAVHGGGDSCRPVGSLAQSLCSFGGDPSTGGMLWRESCTDKSWSSGNCIKLFMNVSDTDITVTDCAAAKLGDGFCFGHQNYGCCRAGQAVFIDPQTGEQVDVNPALPKASNSTTTSTTATSVTSSSSSTTSATAHASPETMSTSTKVGVGAGVGAGVAITLIVIAVAAATFFAMRRRRRSKDTNCKQCEERRSTGSSLRQHECKSCDVYEHEAGDDKKPLKSTEVPIAENYVAWSPAMDPRLYQNQPLELHSPWIQSPHVSTHQPVELGAQGKKRAELA